eukprot:g81108.t1
MVLSAGWVGVGGSRLRALQTVRHANDKQLQTTLSLVRHASSENYYPNVQASQLIVEKTKAPKKKLRDQDLVFGHSFTDHMLVVNWRQGKGWTAPKITPFQPFALSPAASCLHYALTCFEGMKAYLDAQGRIRMFRPDRNMARMQTSLNRLMMPGFDGDEFTKCIKELLKLDKRWFPTSDGYSMYLRPNAIATTEAVSVFPPDAITLYCILSPVGPYFRAGFKPVKLLADTHWTRAWPGGSGAAKVGGNYGPTIMPSTEAAKKGYSQILWLFGDEVTECGTMNFFVLWENKHTGKKELVTPPLERGLILPGVTRMSVLQLAREQVGKEVDVVERVIKIQDLCVAVEEGRVHEAFGVGTACIICPIEGIGYQGKDYVIPMGKNNPDKNAQIGLLSKQLLTSLQNIQYGRVEHEWSVLVD